MGSYKYTSYGHSGSFQHNACTVAGLCSYRRSKLFEQVSAATGDALLTSSPATKGIQLLSSFFSDSLHMAYMFGGGKEKRLELQISDV